MSLLDKHAKLHSNASTQIDVPSGVASKIIEIGRKFIPDEVLAEEGRVMTPHVTVKYGVEEDEEKLRAAIAGIAPFTITLDRTAVFVSGEGSAGGTPVVIEVNAAQLDKLHEAVMAAMGTEGDPFPYVAHITVAYVKEIEAQHFAGAEVFSGITFQATAVVLSKHDDDNQVTVPLGKAMAQTAAAAPAVAPEIPQVAPQTPQQQQEPEVVERDQPATEDDEFKDEEAEAVLEEQRKNEEWRKKQQQRPAPKPRPEHSEYPLPEEEDVRVQDEPRKVTRTKAFKQWFGKSQVVDQNGKPLVVYHGTTHDIQEFDPSAGNVDNYYGKGMYFTDSKLDAAANYATDVGPDITARIERRKEELDQEVWDMAPDQLEEIFGVKEDGEDLDNAIAEKARQDIVGQHGGATIPVYLSLQNPVYVLKQGGTMFEMEYERQDPDDEDSDLIESGTAMKLYQAYIDNAYSFGIDGQEGWGAMMEALGGGESFSAYDFDQAVRKDDRIEDSEGNIAPGSFLQEIYKDAGFDGIIMDAWTAFGHTKYKNMTMDYDTRHYIIWDPTKVKSAIGNKAYDPKNPNITAAVKPKAVKLPETLHDDGWLTPKGQWIDTSMSEHGVVAKQLGFKGKDPRRAAIDAGYTRVTIWEHVQEAIFMFKDSATAHKWMPTLLEHIPVDTENVSVEEGKGNYHSYEIDEAREEFMGGGIKKTPGMKFDYVPWKPEKDTIIAAGTGVGDLGLARTIMHELMPVLGVKLPEPELKMVNQPRAGWLGRDTWQIWIRNGEMGSGDNTVIEVQKSIINDEETLRRVIAHELCHHADSLIEGKEEVEKYKNFGRIGYNQLRAGQRGTGHGASWRAYAAKYNAKYGADFVTEKSDETYVSEDQPLRPYHIRLWKHPSGKIYYAVSSRIGPKMKKWLEHRNVNPDPSERMTTTDSRLFLHGATIGTGWSVPQGKNKAEKEALLQQLWDAAPEVKAQPLSPESQDELDLMLRMRDWNLSRKSSVKTADYWDGLDQTALSVISEYRQKAMENPSYRQKWQVIPAARLAKILKEFTKTGIVHDVKGVDDMAWTILTNIWKIHVNTILAGHTERDPMEFVEYVTGENFEGHDIFNDYDNAYFEDDNGAWRISDYALDDLASAARKLENAQTAEQKIVLIDQIMNIVHARSDLSSWFIQGGRSALNKIFGKGIKSAAVPQIDPLEHGVSKDYDSVRWVYQYFYNNQIKSMSWKDFQKTFQRFSNSPLFTQVRQNRPQITLEDLDRWMQEYREKAKEYQNYEIEQDKYRNKDTSFRDVEQLVLKINQSASAAEIIGEDPMMKFFLQQVAQGSVQSGHPVSPTTVGWLRVDFINDQWLLVDEVQSDLINAVDLAKRFITEPSLQALMDGYKSETVKQKLREMGATEQMFQHSKRMFAQHGYTIEKLDEMKASLTNLFKDWAEYGVASLIEIARRQGIQNVAIHTGQSIAKRDPDLEADKAGRYYDQIAKGFGFKKQQLDVGDLQGEFWVRTASKTAGKRDEAVTSMSIGTDSPEFPSPVLIRWEQGMRWRQVLKVVKSIAGEVAGNRVPWRDIHIWKSLWDTHEAQESGWESEKAKRKRVMFDILHNGSYVSVGAPFGWDAAQEAIGSDVIEASHKTPPLSDTVYNEPELGTETNAYADIPERVEGQYNVPSLSRLMGQRWGSALLKKASEFPVPDFEEVVSMEDGLSSVIPDWSVIRKEVKQRYPNLDPEKEGDPEVEAALDEIGREHALGMWAETEDRLRALKFPLTIYRAFGDVSLKEINRGNYRDRGTGIYWSWDEKNAYVEKELGAVHIVILRGVVQSPDQINVMMTAWKNFVADDEREIELKPGTEIPITGYKYKGETEWHKPPKSLKSVTAEYAEGQAMTQHTDHTPVGLSKTLKSDPFAEELALVHGEIGDIVPNPPLPASNKPEGVAPKAEGEEDLEVNQGQTMKKGFKPDRRDNVPGQVYLLHFDIDPKAVVDPEREDATNPFHARHYLGWAEDAQVRIRQHYQGQGARLTQALRDKGISFTVARIWEKQDDGKPATRNFERRLKSQGSLSRHCPICWREGLIPPSRMRGKALESVEAVPEKYQVGPDYAEVQKEASADEVQAVISEINEKYPENEANPKERMLMSGGKPIAFFEVDDTHKGRLRIRTIRAVEPRQGAGSLALRRITNIADKYGVQIELTASPYGDEETRLNKDDLQAWYRKNNFKDEEGYDPALGYMIRQPKQADTDILIENKGGSVYGDYISVDELPEFGGGMYTSPELQEEFKEKGFHTVVLMHGIEIDRKQRGKGYGDDLLNKFLEEAKGLPIVLSADTAQRQVEGFNLVDWYQKHGFELTGAGSVFPVMVRW